MGSVRKSLALSAIENYLGIVLQLASTVVLARILTPHETGIYAVAAVFSALASNFRDFGVGEFLIQEKTVDDEILRAALLVNIAISWTMGLLLFAAAPWLADFYREPGVREVLQVLACNFILIPFGAITMAWFRRELNFKPIFVVNVTANLVSFIVVVLLGVNGFGYMSLAWSSLAGVAVSVFGISLFRPKGFPRLPGWRGVRRVFDFGKFASLVYGVGQAGKGAPEMILGRVQDMAAVGMFSRAFGLVEIFNRLVLRSLNAVYLPYFARSTREDGTPHRGLSTAIAYLTSVGWPALLVMSVGAYAAIRIIYGEQWLAAVPLAQVLCLAGAVEILYFPAKEALLAQGLAKEANNLQLITQALRVLGLLAAVPFGLAGACWGLLVATICGGIAAHRSLCRLSGWSGPLLWRAIAPSLLVTAIVVLPMLALIAIVPVGEHNFLAMGLAIGLLACLLWIGAIWRLQHPVWAELQKLAAPALRRLQRK